MRRYAHWRPNDSITLADWIEAELSTGDFDDAIAEMIEDDPRIFVDNIEKLIEKGEFDDAVRERARTLGWEAEGDD